MNKKTIASTEVRQLARTLQPTRGLFFGTLILGALLAFELFNYSTTDYALTDLMGNLRFLDIRWATILALAFCGIDFAGIARLFTPQRGAGQPKEVWYLFAAWLLAATMNAMLTWWGVAIAILSHTSLGSTFVSPEAMVTVVPIFVAIMVWIIRVLIIGSLSLAGNRMFSQAELAYQAPLAIQSKPVAAPSVPLQVHGTHTSLKPDPKPAGSGIPRNEPIHHPASMSGTDQPPRSVRK